MFKYPTLIPTGSMMIKLVEELPKTSESYSIYMDNFFTSVPLFSLLREHDYGACRTTRPSSKNFPPEFQHLKKNSSKSIPWSKVYAVVVDNVLCLV